MSIINIKDLHKTYTDTKVPVKAVNGINLSIEEGEFTAIVGPSGSGKTTLLNMIGGLDSPTEGDIMIGGINIKSLSSSALINFRLYNVGFVFQSYNLIPVLTAIENVAFILELQGISKEKRHATARELLHKVGLEGKENYRPGELSGGQQQRVSVARALASKPKFILADEPTANLDSKSTEELLNMMASLNKSENMTFLFSTHDKRVMDKARRIVTVDDGRITADEQNPLN